MFAKFTCTVIGLSLHVHMICIVHSGLLLVASRCPTDQQVELKHQDKLKFAAKVTEDDDRKCFNMNINSAEFQILKKSVLGV